MSKILKKAAPIAGMVAGNIIAPGFGGSIGSALGGALAGGIGGDSPEFDSQQALNSQIQSGTFGVDSPLGNINIQRGANGEIIKQFDQSGADESRNRLIGQGLGGLNLDPSRAEDAFFDRQTRLLQPQFDRQRESLDENLINRGLQLGSERSRQLTGDLRDQQAGTLSDIANQAVFSGQNLLGSQIGNINQLGAGRDINTLNSLGGSLGNTGLSDGFNNQFNDQLALQQDKSQTGQDIGRLLGSSLGGFFNKDEGSGFPVPSRKPVR